MVNLSEDLRKFFQHGVLTLGLSCVNPLRITLRLIAGKREKPTSLASLATSHLALH